MPKTGNEHCISWGDMAKPTEENLIRFSLEVLNRLSEELDYIEYDDDDALTELLQSDEEYDAILVCYLEYINEVIANAQCELQKHESPVDPAKGYDDTGIMELCNMFLEPSWVIFKNFIEVEIRRLTYNLDVVSSIDDNRCMYYARTGNR